MGRAPRSCRSHRLAHRAWARAVSVLALALALTSQLAVLVHMGAVKHETCAEHGELVEVHGAPHGAGVGAAPREPDSTRLGDALAASPVVEDAHDHCPLGATPSLAAAPASCGPAVALAGPLDDVTAPVARVVRASVLRVAPKTSPPAVA